MDDNDVIVYIRGINLIYADDGDKIYYHFNAHGDVVVLTNANGNKTKSYSYNAFGVELNETTLDDNPFRYCGEYYDKVTSTIYLRARYYNPAQGRFTQEDLIRDGYNWYAYCNNNPIMFIDPSGLALKSNIAVYNDGAKNNASINTQNLESSILKQTEDFFAELGGRFVNVLTFMGRLAILPLKSIEASAGLGIGIGADAEVKIHNIPVEVAASASIIDSIQIDSDGFDAVTTSSVNLGVNIADTIDISTTIGEQHSLLDRQCDCDVWNDPYVDRTCCPASEKIVQTDAKDAVYGVSLGLYLLIGIELSLGFNWGTFCEELVDICEEHSNYK